MSRTGGDGLDLSGSELLIERSSVYDFGDKAFSIGEASMVILANNSATKGLTGLAVKDGSSALVVDSVFSELRTGIAAYINKPEFSSPSVFLRQTKFNDYESLTVKDSESSIVFLKEEQTTPKRFDLISNTTVGSVTR